MKEQQGLARIQKAKFEQIHERVDVAYGDRYEENQGLLEELLHPRQESRKERRQERKPNGKVRHSSMVRQTSL